jgi:hypothetical protein
LTIKAVQRTEGRWPRVPSPFVDGYRRVKLKVSVNSGSVDNVYIRPRGGGYRFAFTLQQPRRILDPFRARTGHYGFGFHPVGPKRSCDHASHRIPRWLLANEQLSSMLLAALEYLSAAKQTAPSLGRTASPSPSISLACCASNCSTRNSPGGPRTIRFCPPPATASRIGAGGMAYKTDGIAAQGGRLGRSRLNQSRVSPARPNQEPQLRLLIGGLALRRITRICR